MKNHSKIGNRAGKPAYRTPSSFRYRKYIKTTIAKSKDKAAGKKKNLKNYQKSAVKGVFVHPLDKIFGYVKMGGEKEFVSLLGN